MPKWHAFTGLYWNWNWKLTNRTNFYKQLVRLRFEAIRRSVRSNYYQKSVPKFFLFFSECPRMQKRCSERSLDAMHRYWPIGGGRVGFPPFPNGFSRTKLRDHAQNTTDPAISLVVYNVIPILIGSSAWAPITSTMYQVGEWKPAVSFPRYGEWTRTGYGAQKRQL